MTALTMSECAVRADGTLKEALEINWFNNVNDDKLISELAANPIPSSLSTTLHPIFTGSHAPTTFVAGTFHSARVSRLSTRVLDPNNIKGLSSTTVAKCKARDDGHTTRCLVECKVSAVATSSNNNGTNNNANPSMIVDSDVTETEGDTELAYMSTKEMGDMDCEVNLTC